MKKIKVDKVEVVKVGKAVILVMYYCGLIVGGYKFGIFLAHRNWGFGKRFIAAMGFEVVVQALNSVFFDIGAKLDSKVAIWINKNEVEKELKKKEKKYKRNGVTAEVKSFRDNAIEVDFEVVDEKII